MAATTIFRRKPLAHFDSDGEHTHGGLKRSITTFQLAMIGVGCTIGTGIFFIFETAVPHAGPGIVLSFLIASLVAAFTALCYAELASTIPVSGSSYSYAYATLGEIVAFFVGILLLFEYAIAAAAVAVGWSQYLNHLLSDVVGWQLPTWLSAAPDGSFALNLPAVVLVFLCCLLLLRGASESAKANAIMVCIKLGVLIFFGFIAFLGFKSSNFTPFMPHGFGGVSAAAGSVFFTFVGLDAISTASEEVKDPQKALPRALMIALGIVTLVYVGVAVAAIGAQHWEKFEGQEAGLAEIVSHVVGSNWPGMVLAICALVSIFSCTLVTIFGQTRILFSMSRDGMIPKVFSEVESKHNVPAKNTWIVCIFVALLAAFFPLDILADLVSMGTLLAFTIVSIGVIVLRRREPDRERNFKVPGYPVTPVLSAL
ncbi:MAG: APC family permease, partial [Propionibacteriaceae bacterium]